MKTILGQLKKSAANLVHKAKVRKGLISILAAVFVLQMYFVRELLAAELLFALVFAVLFAIGSLCYLIGAAGERGLYLTEAGVKAVADSARRSYSALEEISRRPFRHPRSQSAQ